MRNIDDTEPDRPPVAGDEFVWLEGTFKENVPAIEDNEKCARSETEHGG
jgi:hypothetical protein